MLMEVLLAPLSDASRFIQVTVAVMWAVITLCARDVPLIDYIAC